jgi:hypothetical protein
MTTVLKINIHDLDQQFFNDLERKMEGASEVEIRIPEKSRQVELFTDAQFWQVIDSLDWSKKDKNAILAPAVERLAAMPVLNIYLFADKLSEKLFLLDTRQHGDAYLANEGDDYLSVDDFLYMRCAVVAEGREYFEKVLTNPTQFPDDLSFEPLLSLADEAYKKNTGRTFDYHPAFNYETYSNKEAWK